MYVTENAAQGPRGLLRDTSDEQWDTKMAELSWVGGLSHRSFNKGGSFSKDGWAGLNPRGDWAE